jgi:hypothetical protein
MTALALLLLVGAAAGQTRNLVGLVIDADCPLVVTGGHNDCFSELYCGVNEIYLVLLNPWNTTLDAPITNVGGFECRLVLPSEIFLLGVALPPASVNFKPLPEMVVGTTVPVAAEQTPLATLTVLVPEYVGDTLYAQLTPVNQAYQSIPGRLAISDAADEFSLHAVDPYGPDGVAVDYTEPMIYFGDPRGSGAPCAVGDDERTWGSLKALYR